MISVKGIYKGKRVVPIEPVEVEENTEVIITFLGKPARLANASASNSSVVDETFGIWSEMHEDGIQYMDRMRKLWDKIGGISE